MPKYEYMVIELPSHRDPSKPNNPRAQLLNGLGRDGWELVLVAHVPGYNLYEAYLKREVRA